MDIRTNESQLYTYFFPKKDSTKLCPTLVIPLTVTCQAPLSMGLSRQEYWSGLPFPSPGDLPNPGTEPRFPALQVDALPTELHRREASFFPMVETK